MHAAHTSTREGRQTHTDGEGQGEVKKSDQLLAKKQEYVDS